MLDEILRHIKKFIPKRLFEALSPIYHYKLALLGALIYRFPSKHLTVIAVTGTKGKSSTTEMLSSIFEAAGKRTAILSTIRFKIRDKSEPNMRKMTIPGRFFVQRFLRNAVDAGCDVAILEMSSEAAKQWRHKFIDLDALVFTNIAPEHIESHGSFENYLNAKLSIARALAKSTKPNTVLVVNGDDKYSHKFTEVGAKDVRTFSLRDAGLYTTSDDAVTFTFKNTKITSPLVGLFNLYNLLGAATCADAFGVSAADIKTGLEGLALIKGRVEFVKSGNPKQDFDVVVDYAHTAGSLEALYKTFEGRKKICVLGNTGGGRDKWKRPEMAAVANRFCDEVILTNEDPYDEDPKKIIDDMLPGFKDRKVTIMMDRRSAIAEAIGRAKKSNVVLITGKGTDPFIMEADGHRTPWSDYKVAREELDKILG
jgi:UDP-N-acetylmuramoyl-L-alanyl-D-glutamate--2,6-diaminopimelate ligase